MMLSLGTTIGLALESVLYAVLQSHWQAISVLMCLMFISPVVVALAYPETAGRDLDEIAPERDTSSRIR
jgi:hypothetical protein